MKKFTLLTLLAASALLSKAQQLPLYSQQYFMRLLYNPALTGYNGSSNIYGFYREQWTAMPGHPVTRGGVADFSLWKDRIGTGLHVYNDKTDIINRISAQVYYAQKINLGKDHKLSLGVAAGVFQANVDFANAIVADGNDPHILDAGKGGVAFDMNVGLAYQWKKLTIGFSVPQVINTRARMLSKLENADLRNKRHYIGSASYEISLKQETWNIEPSILVKYAGVQQVQLDANVMVNYKRIGYLGIGYRLNYGMTAMAAVRIGQVVTLGYGYELPIMGTTAKYRDTKGTHEIIFGVHLDKLIKKKDETPKLDMLDSLMTEQQKLRKDLDSTMAALDSTMHGLDSANVRIDSAFGLIDTLSKRPIAQPASITNTTDSGAAPTNEQQLRLNEYEQQLNEHEQLLRDMRKRIDSVKTMMLDSMENMLKEYKKRISDKPAVNFPDNIDKSTRKPVAGDVYRLNKVEFNSNSSYLKKESYTELDKVAAFLAMNPEARIRISGHTDYTASDEYNQWLSDRRAKRVYDYLVDKGIEPERLSYVGFGKRAPIADNNTEEGRALNRRVEVEVLK